MSADPPLVIAILHADEEDVHYQLYSQAYGIEMQVDDEWNAEAVLPRRMIISRQSRRTPMSPAKMPLLSPRA